MERSIQKQEHPEGGHEASFAFAGPQKDSPSYSANQRRLYRKYRKYRAELARIVGEEEGLDPASIDFDRVIAEAIAEKPTKQKVEFLTRYLEISRESDEVYYAVRQRFFARGKSLVGQELKTLLSILIHVSSIEMERAGISSKMRDAAQKMLEAEQNICISEKPDS